MAKLSLLLMPLVAAASLSMVLAVFDFSTACPIHQLRGDEDKDELCQASFNILDCLEKLPEKNPDCSFAKDTIEEKAKEAKGMLKQIGCGAANLVSSLVLTLGLNSLVYFLTSSQ